MSKKYKRKIDQVTKLLDAVRYNEDNDYIPKRFSLLFMNFIKLVHGQGGEEHPSPVMHMKMLDNFDDNEKDAVANLCFRGSAKTTLIEYFMLYCAVHGGLPNFGKFKYGLYVSDSIENGVKKMRNRLQIQMENSEFLKKYVPVFRPTDVRWYFKNANGDEMVWAGFGVRTGVRGSVELRERPSIAIFDDLLSDENAKSPTVLANIKDTVYGAIEYALHPTHYKVIWNGTPFFAGDPLYKAVNSGAWASNVYPVCEKFPCKKKNFSPAWGERFTYKSLKKKYKKAMKNQAISLFNREMLLRIMTSDEQLVSEDDLQWFSRNTLIHNKHNFKFYVVTDFASTVSDQADWSVAMVIAVNSIGNYYLVDGFCEKQTMSSNIKGLFNLVRKYKPESVGIEVSGQQGGYISWLEDEMMNHDTYFHIASETETNSHFGKKGFRPSTSKLDRFLLAYPIIEEGKFFIAHELKETDLGIEFVEELLLATLSRLKSEHDDAIDCFSQIRRMGIVFPTSSTGGFDLTADTQAKQRMLKVFDEISPWGDLSWDDDEDDDYDGGYSDYIV